MDYLRLGLERGKSASESLEIITQLLEVYGQSGNCGFDHPFYYQNSFIIADRKEAWKLETVGKEWIAEKISGFGAISNGYSIETGDRFSENLIAFAEEKNWKKANQSFNFREAYSDWIFTTFSDSKQRQSCSIRKINETGRKTTLTDVFSTLRSHREEENFKPDKGLAGADLCMHAGFGPIRLSQTTGSMVVVQDENDCTVWVTGSSAPCLSIFKPMSFDQTENYFGAQPKESYDEESYWWKQERIHRRIIMDYQNLSRDYQKERDELEKYFVDEMTNTKSPLTTIESSFEKAFEFQRKWNRQLDQMDNKNKTNFLYSFFWNKNNSRAKIPLD
jgi:dipeptidase